MFKNILVPVDGSELSDAAVTRACSFAREASARLTFYYAKPGYFPASIAGEALFNDVENYNTYLAAMEKQAESILRKAAKVAVDAGVPADTVSEEYDTPHEGIIAAAEGRGCDLIFMASHGRRGVGALLLGSETNKVLTHCKIPVLVYR